MMKDIAPHAWVREGDRWLHRPRWKSVINSILRKIQPWERKFTFYTKVKCDPRSARPHAVGYGFGRGRDANMDSIGTMCTSILSDADALAMIFDMQIKLMQHFRSAGHDIPMQPVDLTTKFGQRACRDAALKAAEEIFESIQHFKNWKPHRKTDVPHFNRDEWLEEVVDAFAYLWEMLILAGVTPDEFLDATTSKITKVHRRIDEGY